MLSEKKKINYKLPATKKIFCNPKLISCAPEDFFTEENTIL